MSWRMLELTLAHSISRTQRKLIVFLTGVLATLREVFVIILALCKTPLFFPPLQCWSKATNRATQVKVCLRGHIHILT